MRKICSVKEPLNGLCLRGLLVTVVEECKKKKTVCVVCWRIHSSISILNDCLTAPRLLAASSTTSALCPHYHADLYFQKYNSLIIPAVIVFVQAAKAGRALSEKAFMCSAASVLPQRRNEAEAQQFIHLSLRGRRRVRHSVEFWQDSKGNQLEF